MNKSVHSLLVGALLAGGVIASAAQAQAAECTWQRTELPVPESYHSTVVYGTGGDYVVGTTKSDQEGLKTILWHKGQGTFLAPPTTNPRDSALIQDVNNSGTVTGTVLPERNYPDYRPYVTKADGTTHFLARPAGWYAKAVAINDFGDVVGNLYSRSGPESVAVVWSGLDYSKYREVDGADPTIPVGIDNSGTVVTSHGQILPWRGGSWWSTKPVPNATLQIRTYDGLITGTSYVAGQEPEGVVWNLDGSIRYRVAGMPFVANHQGTTVGASNTQEFRLWRNGVVATGPDPAPLGGSGLSIDDSEVITGVFSTDDGDTHAAQWRCR